jgi:hypothetical protein
MIKKIIKNKKGQIGETMQELAGTIIIALIVIFAFIFSLVFGLPNLNTEKISEDVSDNIYNYYFLASKLYETTSFEYVGESHEITLIDLAKLNEIDENIAINLENLGLSLELGKLDSFKIPAVSEDVYLSKQNENK